jgi:hypothetical protein
MGIMRDKRGSVFALVLVPIVLFLCGVVIVLYAANQDDTQASLVSPSSVLEMRDDLTLFELREIVLIKSSLSDDSFGGSFRDSFIDGVMADDDMREFLFEDLFVGGVEIREQDKNRNLLERIYLMEDDSIFSRAKIEKRSLLVAEYESRIDFPVYFSFEFEREYLIDKNGGVTKV